MSEFISLLNNFIENSGISQSQISRDVNISRTKLNKCLNGKRNLTFQELEQICDYLSLSSFQVSALKAAYANRDLTAIQLRNFLELENLFRTIYESKRINRNQLIIHPVNQIELKSGHYFGRLNVLTMIKKIIRSHYDIKNKVDLVMNLPLYDNLLRQFFIEILCNLDSNFQITHLAPVNFNDSLINEDFNVLDVLSQVMPLVVLGQFRYYCLNYDAYLLKNEFNIYPYFIVVNNTALFIADDFKNMRVETDGEAVRYCVKVSELQKLAATPLIRQRGTIPEQVYDMIFSDDKTVWGSFRAKKTYSITQIQDYYRQKISRASNFWDDCDYGGISVLVKNDQVFIKPDQAKSDCFIIDNKNFIKNFKDYFRANVPVNF